MKRQSALFAAAILYSAALFGGCTNNDPPATSTPPTPAASSSAPASPAAAKTYTMPDNLCNAVTADAFADLTGGTPTLTSEMARSITERRSSSTCAVTLGQPDKKIIVRVGVDLFKDTSGAQGNYEGFRGVVFKDNPGTRDLSGIGTAAYFFTEPTLGPHLVVHHGNAHLALAATGESSKTLPADIEARLIVTAKATLNKLPTP